MTYILLIHSPGSTSDGFGSVCAGNVCISPREPLIASFDSQQERKTTHEFLGRLRASFSPQARLTLYFSVVHRVL